MERGQNVTLSLESFCNQIIHSWVWMLSADGEPRRFDGIYVCSDKERHTGIYYVGVDALVQVFRTVGLDDIVELRWEMDDQGERQVTQASREYSPNVLNVRQPGLRDE